MLRFSLIVLLTAFSFCGLAKVYNHPNLNPETFLNGPKSEDYTGEPKQGMTLLTKFLDDNTIKENGGVYDETGFDGLSQSENISPSGSIERLTQRAKSSAALWAQQTDPEANYDIIGTNEDPENLIGWVSYNVLMISRSKAHKMVKVCLPIAEDEKISFVIELWEKCSSKSEISKQFQQKINPPNKKKKLTGNEIDEILKKAGINVEELKGNKSLSATSPITDVQFLIQKQKQKIQAQEDATTNAFNFLQTSFEFSQGNNATATNAPEEIKNVDNGIQFELKNVPNSSPKPVLNTIPTATINPPVITVNSVNPPSTANIPSPPSINPPIMATEAKVEPLNISPEPSKMMDKQIEKPEVKVEEKAQPTSSEDHKAILDMREQMQKLNSQLSDLTSVLSKTFLANKKEESASTNLISSAPSKKEEKVEEKIKNFESSDNKPKANSDVQPKRSKKIFFSPSVTKVTIKNSGPTPPASEEKKRNLRFAEKASEEEPSISDSMINALALNQ